MAIDPARLEILHEHYRDSCSIMQSQRTSRDRYFFMVIAAVALAWFDVVAPNDFGTVIGESVRAQLQLQAAPDLAYLRSVLWFIVLGLSIRYFQTSLLLERTYDYIHDLEAILAREIHERFAREGVAYLSKYPLFMRWARFLYVVVAPTVLVSVVAGWTAARVASWSPVSWSKGMWFDVLISAGIVISVVLYWLFRLKLSDGGGSRTPEGDDRQTKKRPRRA